MVLLTPKFITVNKLSLVLLSSSIRGAAAGHWGKVMLGIVATRAITMRWSAHIR